MVVIDLTDDSRLVHPQSIEVPEPIRIMLNLPTGISMSVCSVLQLLDVYIRTKDIMTCIFNIVMVRVTPEMRLLFKENPGSYITEKKFIDSIYWSYVLMFIKKNTNGTKTSQV